MISVYSRKHYVCKRRPRPTAYSWHLHIKHDLLSFACKSPAHKNSNKTVSSCLYEVSGTTHTHAHAHNTSNHLHVNKCNHLWRRSEHDGTFRKEHNRKTRNVTWRKQTNNASVIKILVYPQIFSTSRSHLCM